MAPTSTAATRAKALGTDFDAARYTAFCNPS